MFFFPLINDVATTPLDPPAYAVLARAAADAGRDRGYPPENARIQAEAYPDLAPFALAEPPAAGFARAQAAARRMPGWELVAADPSALRVEAVAATRLLRFKDDVVIEVRAAPGGCAVHMRSRSRLGRGDFGANARRIRAFGAALGAGHARQP